MNKPVPPPDISAAADPLFALLLQLLRGHAPSYPINGNTWAALIRLAQRNTLLLAFKESIDSLHLELPLIAHHRLLRATRQETATNLRYLQALHEVLDTTAAAGLTLIPLKGPALLERLFNNPCRRRCADLDLLVLPVEVPHILQLLTNLGYREVPILDHLKWTWERGDITLEFHGELADQLSFPHDMDAIWSRTQPSTLQGRPTRRLHPADELVFLSLHAARHRFRRLNWTLELGRAFDLLGSEIGFTMPPFYRAQTVPGILLLGQAMIQHSTASAPAPFYVDAGPALRRRVASLAQEFWNESLAQRWPPHAQFRVYEFLHQLEPTLAARLGARIRQLWLVSTSVNTADEAFAARFGLQSPPTVWTVRQLRLIGLLTKFALRKIALTG